MDPMKGMNPAAVLPPAMIDLGPAQVFASATVQTTKNPPLSREAVTL